MAITRLATSSLKTLNKYDDFLAGNAAYNPSSFYSIATVTTSGVKTLTFSSIPSTYKALQVRMMALSVTAGAGAYIQFNGDTASNYATHFLSGNGTAVSAGGYATQPSITFSGNGPGAPTSTYPYVGIVDIQDYASTSKNKTVRAFTGADNNGATIQHEVDLSSGLWISTAAISSLTITADYNWSAGSTFALYGVK